jgi:soluble lytic murein transglycosylase-like protein
MNLSSALCAAVIALGIGDNSSRADFACKNMHYVVNSAQAHKVSPALLLSLIHHESRWKPDTISRSNACGLTQVIPKWTGGRATDGKKYTCKELFEPKVSIDLGARLLSFWIKDYGKGRINLGLCGYNAGYRCKGSAPNQSGRSYAQQVRKTAKKIKRFLKKREKAARIRCLEKAVVIGTEWLPKCGKP